MTLLRVIDILEKLKDDAEGRTPGSASPADTYVLKEEEKEKDDNDEEEDEEGKENKDQDKDKDDAERRAQALLPLLIHICPHLNLLPAPTHTYSNRVWHSDTNTLTQIRKHANTHTHSQIRKHTHTHMHVHTRRFVHTQASHTDKHTNANGYDANICKDTETLFILCSTMLIS